MFIPHKGAKLQSSRSSAGSQDVSASPRAAQVCVHLRLFFLYRDRKCFDESSEIVSDFLCRARMRRISKRH
jgi:hypothetical protein